MGLGRSPWCWASRQTVPTTTTPLTWKSREWKWSQQAKPPASLLRSQWSELPGDRTIDVVYTTVVRQRGLWVNGHAASTWTFLGMNDVLLVALGSLWADLGPVLPPWLWCSPFSWPVIGVPSVSSGLPSPPPDSPLVA